MGGQKSSSKNNSTEIRKDSIVEVHSWVVVVALVAAFCLLVFSVSYYFYRTQRKHEAGGELAPTAIRIYVCGATYSEGFYIAKPRTVKIFELAAAFGTEFSADYYDVHGIRYTKTVQNSDVTVINGNRYALVYFPAPNPLPVYSLNEVTAAQLVGLGLNSALAENVIAYREEHGPFSDKGKLLTLGLLTEVHYKVIYRNLYCLPDEISAEFAPKIAEINDALH